MAEEVRFHLEQFRDDLVRSGVEPEEAARRARIEFGNVDNVKDDCREARGLRLFDAFQRDVWHAARRLRKTPGFTAAVLATLALCIGANLAVFAVVDHILLRPLPFPASGRLVRVFNTYPRHGVRDAGCSVTNYYERRGNIAAFATLSAYREGTAIVGGPGSTEREQVAWATPEFFTTLGLGPTMGRTFTEEETTYGTDGVAILAEAYWRQHLGADPSVMGRSVRVDGLDKIVVGILPPGFRLLSSEPRIYLPFASNLDERQPQRRHWGGSHMIARLLPGATVTEAQSQVNAHNATKEAKVTAENGFHTLVVPLHADHVSGIRSTLLLVQAGALFLLLIGAVNLANLLLIRASGRVRELAVRQAIGASRGHVVSGVTVETILLTLAGGLLGLAVGWGGIRLLVVLGAQRLPLGAHVGIDAPLALVALLGAITVGVAIGLPVTWYSLRCHTASALTSGTRGAGASRAVQHLRYGFLVAQMGLAFVLLAGAGLLSLSLEKIEAVPPGFRPERILSGQISLPGKDYPDTAGRSAFILQLMEQLGHQPGVLTAGVITNVPFSGNNDTVAARAKGHVYGPDEPVQGHYSYGVSGDYFGALGIPLREGRVLTSTDSHRTQRVCVVDEDFARRYWPKGGALGQGLFQGVEEGKDEEAFTVVGVVGTVRQAGLADADPQGAVYYPYAHRAESALFVVARTSLSPESLGVTVQGVVRKIDADLPVSDVRSMQTRIADSIVAQRSSAVLASLFSWIAVLLTVVGTYGVLSYAVAQRRREIGLRVALGARPAQVRAQFVFLALRLLGAGMVLGLLGTWLTGQAIQAVLFQVPAFHTATIAGTAAIVGVVSLSACLLPSHRATHISPLEALAEE